MFLAEIWRLPPQLQAVIGHHHNPLVKKSNSAIFPLISVVHIADVVARALGLGLVGDPFVPRHYRECYTSIGLTVTDIENSIEEVQHIYAAGDVIGPPALAATGMEQARVAMCHAFGVLLKSDMSPLLPTGIYTIPEASMVGATEEALIKDNVEYVVGRARYADNPRGRIMGDEAGFLKLLFRRSDLRLLGVHVVGEQATEVVHIGLMAMLMEANSDVFNRACFNYPTLGDLYKYATYDALIQIQEEQAHRPDDGFEHIL